MAVSQLLADVCSQLALILGHTLSYTQHRSKYAFVYMRAVARALTGGRSTRRVDLSRVIGRDLVLSEIGDSRGSRGIRIIREDVGIFAQSALGPEAERKSPWWSVGDGWRVFREQEASAVSIEALNATRNAKRVRERDIGERSETNTIFRGKRADSFHAHVCVISALCGLLAA